MIDRRLLLLGKSGQLGWALQRSLALHGRIVVPDTATCDLAKPEDIRAIVREVKPDVVVNAAAYTAVDRAETERELAHRVNAVAPAIVAEEADRSDALMIHYSTDYVFDGEKAGAYVETDSTNPLNVYGETKLEGERGVQRSGAAALIFRTSWVYGLIGKNFPKTILTLAKERPKIRVVADQFGAPTSVDLLADVTSLCVSQWFADRDAMRSRCGLYHLAPSGETSWYGLATELLSKAQSCGITLAATPDQVEAIAAAEYPTAARRPKNSRLDTGKLARAFGLQLPPWPWHIHRLVQELGVLQK